MPKSKPVDPLTALKALNDEMSQSTIPDAKLRKWDDRLAAVRRQCRDFAERWMQNPPIRRNIEMTPWLTESAAMSLEIQNVWRESFKAARTPADFLKLDVGLWGYSLTSTVKIWLSLMQLPCATITSRSYKQPRPDPLDEFSPIVKQRLIEAASRTSEEKPTEGGQ